MGLRRRSHKISPPRADEGEDILGNQGKKIKEQLNEFSSSRTLFSKLYFCWIWPILRLGKRRNLTLADIPPIPDANSCRTLGNSLIIAWSNERKLKRPSLWRTLFRVYWKGIVLQGILYVFSQVLQISRSLLLSYFLEAYTRDPQGKETVGLGLLLIFVTLGNVLSINPCNFLSSELGMNMSTSLTGLVHHKTLRLSVRGFSQTNQGQIINLVSNDVKRLETRVGIIHAIWVGPLVTLAAIIILTKYNPVATFGMLVLGLLIPTCSLIGVSCSRFLTKVGTFRDTRLKILDEIITNIPQIKIYSWESVFSKKVQEVRRSEAEHLKRRWDLWATYRNIYITSPQIVVFIALLASLLSSGSLNPETVFLISCLYNTVSSLMSQAFPSAVFLLTGINVSIRRCQEFLLLDEQCAIGNSNITRMPNNGSVTMVNFTGQRFLDEPPVLHQINLNATVGNPLVITGPSSLFSAICGDLLTVEGFIETKGRIAFAGQTPWTFPATIRENITFGRPFHRRWYREVLNACALMQDVATFPLRDLQVLNNKGISLSGGQRARITLARAVYADADIYLLDNILAPVDSAVGAHLIQNLLYGILKSKCVILSAEPIAQIGNEEFLYFENGRILETQKYTELRLEKPELFKAGKLKMSQTGHTSNIHNPRENFTEIEKKEWSPIPSDATCSNQPAQQEKSDNAIPGFSTIYKYFQISGSRILPILVIVVFILFQTCRSSSSFMLIRWINASQSGTSDNGWLPSTCKYFILVGFNIVLGQLGLLMFYHLCSLSGQQLHDGAFEGLLHTKLNFFSKTTAGTILNAFSTDMGSIDEDLPQLVEAAISSILQLIGILGVAVSLNNILIIPGVILGIFFIHIRNLYLIPSSEIRRMEAITRSPVYNNFIATLDGLTTIRTLGQEGYFKRKLYKLKDSQTACYYAFLASFNWFIFWMDFSVLFFSITSITAFIIFPTDTAATGLAISLIFSADNLFSYGMQQTVELGNEFLSVSRILKYFNLPPEDGGKEGKAGGNGSHIWKPQRGKIEFRNVEASYASGTPVLKDINLTINSLEKVGIIGRTGAGKTTLFNLILRLADTCTGTIWIDGRNIMDIDIHELWSNISVISQTPALIEGSLRNNLDPTNIFSDLEIQAVTDVLQLSQRMQAKGLQTRVESGGSNFSHGERQLICLARAMLRESKILLLDEATANVDKGTEEVILKVIQERFQNSTIVSIAHSLDTVLPLETIVVIDGGQIVEMGSPASLMKDPQSQFNKLVNIDRKSKVVE